MQELNAKHIVVTGASGALGRGVVPLLLERGAVCHLPMEEAEVPIEIPWREHPQAHATPGVNLQDESVVQAYFQGLPELWGSVHLVGGFAMMPFLDTTLADLKAQFEINVVTCFLCCREAARRMASTGGRIVNVAARPALQPPAQMSAYASAKAAVVALTQSVGQELLPQDILVNAVVPSIIDTPSNRAAMPDADFGQWPRPQQLAQTVAFLISPQNQVTSGALVPAYGRV